jgi:hypothetical protein
MSYTAKDLDPLVRGDDWSLKLNITSSNSPVDITGYTYTWTLKDNVDDPDPGALQVTLVASGSSAAIGEVILSATAAVTTNITPQTYTYDVQQVNTTGVVQTLLLGKVKVVKDITRTT